MGVTVNGTAIGAQATLNNFEQGRFAGTIAANKANALTPSQL
jgi:hypothetical protein